MNKELINSWVKEKIITKEQAAKIEKSVAEYNSSSMSQNFIRAVSIIGALALGLGVILFVASNWEEISSVVKVFILAGSTFFTLVIGHYLREVRTAYEKTGGALIFLAALLFGASVMLIAQIYHVNAHAHWLLLLWLLGILPMVYIYRLKALAFMAVVLTLFWTGFFSFRGVNFDENFLRAFPTIFMLTGTALFGLGGLNYFSDKLKDIARSFRVLGVLVGVLALMPLTFRFFSGQIDSNGYLGFMSLGELAKNSPSLVQSLLLFSVVSVISLGINLYFNPAKARFNIWENTIPMLFAVFGTLVYLFPVDSNLYTIIYNVGTSALLIFLFFVGFNRRDASILNVAYLGTFVYLILKYFDVFFDRIDKWSFFIIGGAVLLIGAVLMEKNRRHMLKAFSSK